MNLRRFTPSCAHAVLSWAADRLDLKYWCGLIAPNLDASVFERWHLDPDVRAYVLFDDSTPVAYGELWIDVPAAEIELARLIVDPQRRGCGLGQTLVKKLQAECAAYPDLAQNVFLRVHLENRVAQKAYQNTGFVRVPEAEERSYNQSLSEAFVWMRWRPNAVR